MPTPKIGIAALALACTMGLANAQSTAPSTTPSATPETPSTDATRPADSAATNTTTAPAKTETPPIAGANSFTEAQARDRIAKAGFDDVKELKKDDQGIWRGQASKSGQSVGVALDFRGNVVQQ